MFSTLEPDKKHHSSSNHVREETFDREAEEKTSKLQLAFPSAGTERTWPVGPDGSDVLREGFPILLECTWNLPSARIVVLLVLKEKTVRLSGVSFIKQISAALFFFFPCERRKTHK